MSNKPVKMEDLTEEQKAKVEKLTELFKKEASCMIVGNHVPSNIDNNDRIGITWSVPEVPRCDSGPSYGRSKQL